MSILESFVERRFQNYDSSLSHKRAAKTICKFFETNPQDIDEKLFFGFYQSLEYLLKDPGSERILLYIPFSVLESAPYAFRETYLEVWRKLLRVQDVRANFFDGDCFEIDARPNGESERVIKCLHLLPWLFEMGYISASGIDFLISISEWDDVFRLNLREAVCVMVARGLISKDDPKISGLMRDFPQRKKIKPLYTSEKRVEWLSKRNNQPAKLLTPNIDLSNPFSDSFETLMPKLKEIEKSLCSSEIALVGGSQVKGYGTVESDLDVWEFDKLRMDDLFYPGSPHSAHIFFNSIWVSGKDINNLENAAQRIIGLYPNLPDKETRRLSIEKLESDLLQYRLLHKGFSQFFGKTKFQTSKYPEIDGDCPFYDDEYRKIATMLYAKYVWI